MPVAATFPDLTTENRKNVSWKIFAESNMKICSFMLILNLKTVLIVIGPRRFMSEKCRLNVKKKLGNPIRHRYAQNHA